MIDQLRVHDLSTDCEPEDAVWIARADLMRARAVDQVDRGWVTTADDPSELSARPALDRRPDARADAPRRPPDRLSLDAPDAPFHVAVHHSARQAQHACDAAAVELEAGTDGE